MPSCIECGEYTKFNGGLCKSCYSADQKKKYSYNTIKGRIAETLIQELSLSLNFNVFKYGMENTIPGIMHLLKGVRTDVAKTIRRMPDFVIQDSKDNTVYFVEVKYRKNGNFNISDLDNEYPYENALFIIVSKRHIKCLSYQELKSGQEITEKSRNYLGNRKEFELNKETIKDYCNYATKFFEGID
jgi:hypothetical protein